MPLRLHAITFDCADPQALAAWWSQVLGLSIGNDYGHIVALATKPGMPFWFFQKIDAVPTQRNRVHSDFATADLDAETERLLGLGATLIEEFNKPEIRYTTFADPDGNTFDVVNWTSEVSSVSDAWVDHE